MEIKDVQIGKEETKVFLLAYDTTAITQWNQAKIFWN